MQRSAALVASIALGLARASVIALPIVSLVPAAQADVRKVTPRVVVVTKDNAALRCADGPIYYPVRMLKAGDVLRIDGEGGGWLRAEYPSGTRAYVKADDASFDAGTKTVKLVKASKLMAANDTGARPWWYLLDTDMAAGTTFSPADPARAADGTVEGYLVPAPAAARGFIRTEMVRNATPEEAAKLTGTPVAAKPAETPKPSDTAAKPPETSVKPADTSKPAEPATTASKPADASKPAETPKPADTTQAAKPTPTPAPTSSTTTPPTPPPAAHPDPNPPPTAPEIIEMKPAEAAPTTKAPAPTTPVAQPVAAAPRPEVTKRIDDISVLRELFDRVMKHSEDESEVQTVISEFNRKIDTLPMSGEDAKVRRALEQRREVLVLRQEVIENRRKARSDADIDQRMKQIRLAVEQAERQAIYTIVGRILPSTVYDGKRGMPLMYRIESPDITSTRTIGYVLPREAVDLLPKMGKLVGIIGEAKLDPALGLNIVAPQRVDEMQFANGRLEPVPGTSTGTVPTPPGAGSTPAPGSTSAPAATPAAQPVATPGSDSLDVNK